MAEKILIAGLIIYLLGIYFYIRPVKTGDSYNTFGVFCLVVGFLAHMVGVIVKSYQLSYIPFDTAFGVAAIVTVFFLGEYMFLEYRHKVQRLAFVYLVGTVALFAPFFLARGVQTRLASFTDIIFGQFYFACVCFSLASMFSWIVSRSATIYLEQRSTKTTKTALKVFKKTRKFGPSSSFLALSGTFASMVCYAFIILEMKKLYFLSSLIAVVIAFALLLTAFILRKNSEVKQQTIVSLNTSALVVLLIALLRLIV